MPMLALASEETEQGDALEKVETREFPRDEYLALAEFTKRMLNISS